MTDSDGNNNDFKSITPCVTKMNDEQKSTCKITNIENHKVSTEAKDKGKFMYKICIYLSIKCMLYNICYINIFFI